jgi:hypothetical protein
MRWRGVNRAAQGNAVAPGINRPRANRLDAGSRSALGSHRVGPRALRAANLLISAAAAFSGFNRSDFLGFRPDWGLMRPRDCSPVRWSTPALAVSMLALFSSTLVLFAATPASATPETLKRSVGNILFAPLDIAASPITAGKALYNNLREIDDSRWVRIVFPVPGYGWLLGVQIGGGAIREIAGLLELLPGLGLLFFDADLDPLYDPAERNDALVEVQTPPLKIKFGVNYVASPSPSE